MGSVTGNQARGAGDVLAGFGVRRLLVVAADGDGEACHALGVAYSTAPGAMRDLIEAHKWFNLGAMHGSQEAGWCRAEVAAEMTRAEIAEAQRRARQWLGGETRRAA